MSSCAKIMIPFTSMEPMKPMIFLDCRRRSWAKQTHSTKGQNCARLPHPISVQVALPYVHAVFFLTCSACISSMNEFVRTVVTFINCNPSPPQKKHCEMSSSFSSKLCLQFLGLLVAEFHPTPKKLRSKHQHKQKLSIRHSVQKPYRHRCWNALTPRNFDASKRAQEFHLQHLATVVR